MDPRIEQLAYNLVHNSCRLQKGEKVMIHQNGIHPAPLVKAIKIGRASCRERV